MVVSRLIIHWVYFRKRKTSRFWKKNVQKQKNDLSFPKGDGRNFPMNKFSRKKNFNEFSNLRQINVHRVRKLFQFRQSRLHTLDHNIPQRERLDEKTARNETVRPINVHITVASVIGAALADQLRLKQALRRSRATAPSFGRRNLGVRSGAFGGGAFANQFVVDAGNHAHSDGGLRVLHIFDARQVVLVHPSADANPLLAMDRRCRFDHLFRAGRQSIYCDNMRYKMSPKKTIGKIKTKFFLKIKKKNSILLQKNITPLLRKIHFTSFYSSTNILFNFVFFKFDYFWRTFLYCDKKNSLKVEIGGRKEWLEPLGHQSFPWWGPCVDSSRPNGDSWSLDGLGDVGDFEGFHVNVALQIVHRQSRGDLQRFRGAAQRDKFPYEMHGRFLLLPRAALDHPQIGILHVG